ncbi:SMAD/FHA domain-containing protein [Lipomyces starkeyi]
MTPFIDHSSTTPALYFEPIERRGKSGNVIRLGRYTDKKEMSKLEAAYAPVVFKSKVVSRAHAEIWVEDGQWFVKDIKSSSGTFLNHIRLSPACQLSQAFPIKDGDIIQLGMDFRGGSEEVYKCVKMRLEINRSWQKRINNFNVSAHTRLRSLTQSQPTQAQQQECSICLVSVAPCQSLFVAPCSHVWHYKCIRPIIIRNYPQFLCPNCRAVCDLEADVEQEKTHEDVVDEVLANSASDEGSGSSSGEAANDDEELSASVISRMNVMTPSNEAGPFVFDGMIVSSSSARQLTQALQSVSAGAGTGSSTPVTV